MCSDYTSDKTFRVVSVDETDRETETWVRAPSRQDAERHVREKYADDIKSTSELFAVSERGRPEAWIASDATVDVES